jgi:hypothetical protein
MHRKNSEAGDKAVEEGKNRMPESGNTAETDKRQAEDTAKERQEVAGTKKDSESGNMSGETTMEDTPAVETGTDTTGRTVNGGNVNGDEVNEEDKGKTGESAMETGRNTIGPTVNRGKRHTTAVETGTDHPTGTDTSGTPTGTPTGATVNQRKKHAATRPLSTPITKPVIPEKASSGSEIPDGMIRGAHSGWMMPPRPWPKGVSGNPAGRPKGQPMITPRIKRKLGEVCDSDPQKRIWAEVVVERLLQLVCKGNPQAIREVLERLEGKVRHEVQIDVSLDRIRQMSDDELEQAIIDVGMSLPEVSAEIVKGENGDDDE